MRWTKIGEGGKAIMERHFSYHNKMHKHSYPHDHIINWDENNGNPSFGGPINYGDDIPEFKGYKGDVRTMLNNDYNFESISDFKDSVNYGGEVEFEWKGKAYTITRDGDGFGIGEGYYEKDGKYYNVCSHTEYNIADEKYYQTADELLEFMVGEDRLGDVVTQIYVVMRNI